MKVFLFDCTIHNATQSKTDLMQHMMLNWISQYFLVIKMNMNQVLGKCKSIIFNLLQILINALKLQLNSSLQNTQNNCVRILYQSQNFLVVHKPYDMFINSNNPERKYTLQSELRKMLPELINPKLCHEFHFVHRLDYATSGVICIALNKQAARAASTEFETRTVKKFYLALLHGHINESYIIIDKAIGTDIREKTGNHKMCTSDSNFCEKPRNSYTILIVLEHGLRNGQPATKVLLCPGTGRRHQLRVHCNYIGHTVIGDYTYSDGKDIEPHRTFLHSFRLILNSKMENVDVRSRDPFEASDTRNQWSPTNIIRPLDESIFSDVYKLIK